LNPNAAGLDIAGGIRVSARDDREHVRIDLQQSSHRLDPADTVLDREVADEEVETLAFFHRIGVDRDGLAPLLRLDDLVSGTAQGRGHESADRGIVLEDEDAGADEKGLFAVFYLIAQGEVRNVEVRVSWHALGPLEFILAASDRSAEGRDGALALL